jgi:hypothetical protein
MPVISALGRQRQEDSKFKANLGYIVKFCLQKTKIKNTCDVLFASQLNET